MTVLQAIAEERERQEALWGTESDLLRSHSSIEEYLYHKYVVLGEEVGEVAKDMLEGTYNNLFIELVQVSAVCTAIAELLLEERVKIL